MIAYFVMELGLEESMPIYSGGLGTLAGDTLFSYADMDIPAVCVTLLYKRGYNLQKITPMACSWILMLSGTIKDI